MNEFLSPSAWSPYSFLLHSWHPQKRPSLILQFRTSNPSHLFRIPSIESPINSPHIASLSLSCISPTGKLCPHPETARTLLQRRRPLTLDVLLPVVTLVLVLLLLLLGLSVHHHHARLCCCWIKRVGLHHLLAQRRPWRRHGLDLPQTTAVRRPGLRDGSDASRSGGTSLCVLLGLPDFAVALGKGIFPKLLPHELELLLRPGVDVVEVDQLLEGVAELGDDLRGRLGHLVDAAGGFLLPADRALLRWRLFVAENGRCR
mmetsp:Transcript_4503/g.9511  ORF Transcript_4503/g.9511 Transcript_4503/m.9511 type:complete len:259 (-) Transcript_4503:1688-2464(-)